MKERYIVIGDVHGCLREFCQLMEKCDFRPERDQMVFVGDLVDKGPDSKEVVSLAMHYGAQVVRGNHDDKHFRFNRNERNIADPNHKMTENPLRKPGQEHFAYWEMSDSEFEFFKAMPSQLNIPGWTVVHAGFECTGQPIEKQKGSKTMWIRDVYPETGKIATTGVAGQRVEGAVRWARRWTGPENVIYGHAPFYQVFKVSTTETDTLGIDTGCVHGGALTAVVVDAKMPSSYRIVQVRAEKCYEKSIVEGEDFVANFVPDDTSLLAGLGRGDVKEASG